ncbi:hypothetical protein RX327_33765 [Bradyrhizobium sp. BEA-2-5]|uniref:hypothetical protein n=1 Tax=Bradyrhizobium sp. BEA-2-5 TaxID=3080015 RepID=UPI00293ECE9E|nr:hypothetical protein [Bradyrhizobium sp. BEA-2-5]WOH80669.1 hypothetical protein RX327_33765 [Bradyrhizobium sp. BEA-2-5]
MDAVLADLSSSTSASAAAHACPSPDAMTGAVREMQKVELASHLVGPDLLERIDLALSRLKQGVDSPRERQRL